jgi:hypothetical protein
MEKHFRFRGNGVFLSGSWTPMRLGEHGVFLQHDQSNPDWAQLDSIVGFNQAQGMRLSLTQAQGSRT